MSENINKILEEIKGLTLLEVNDLVKALEEEFGVSAAAQVVTSVAGQTGKAEEKSEFDVILKTVGSEKIKVIKVVREITGLGLADAKGLVDSAPKAIKEQISKEEAETIKTKLTEVGAEVEIK